MSEWNSQSGPGRSPSVRNCGFPVRRYCRHQTHSYSAVHGPPQPHRPTVQTVCLLTPYPIILIMDASRANLTHPGLQPAPSDGHITHNGQTTPPSPLTGSSSVPALFSSASTLNTDYTSLSSDVSKLSLGTVKKPVLGEPPAVIWPYSHATALDDISGIAYALDMFLKSLMVESEEYCHRCDPKKCVSCAHISYPVPVCTEASTPLRERLYFATGSGLIQCVKALMSYEDDVRDCSYVGNIPPSSRLIGPFIRNWTH